MSEHNQAKTFNKAVCRVRIWVRSCNPAASTLPKQTSRNPRALAKRCQDEDQSAGPNDAVLHLEEWALLHVQKGGIATIESGLLLLERPFLPNYLFITGVTTFSSQRSHLPILVSFRHWISLLCTTLDLVRNFTVNIKHNKNTTNHHQRLTFIKG